MAFSTQEDDSVLSDINITPLVDVMLVLLVSFILTIPVLVNAVHINLPKTVSTTPPDQQKAVTVTVNGDAQIYLDNQPVSSEELEGQLIALRSSNSDLALHLRADERVPYGPVAKVMAQIEHAGITHVSVLTDQQ
jgi:biopolymer transport protein ExbD